MVLPLRPGDPGQAQAQAVALLRRRPRGGRRRARTRRASTTSRRCCTAEGLDAYVVRRLGLSFRDVDWTQLGRPARAGAPPAADGHRRDGRQVRRPARRVPVGERGDPGGRVRPPGPGASCAGCPATSASPRPARRRRWPAWTAWSSRAASAYAASRARSARPGTPGRTASRSSGLCLGPAVHDHRGGPAPGRPGRAPTRWSSTSDAAAPGHRHHGRPGGHRRRQGRPGRHDAAGRVPGDAAPRARSSPRRTAAPRSASGTGTGTR